MNQVGSIKTTFIIITSKNFLLFPEGRERVYWELRFFFSYFIQIRCFFIHSLPYGGKFSPTCNLGSLFGLSQVPVFSQNPLLALDYRWESTHLLKYYYPQLVLNPYRFEIRPLKQLNYLCMPLHPVLNLGILELLQLRGCSKLAIFRKSHLSLINKDFVSLSHRK